MLRVILVAGLLVQTCQGTEIVFRGAVGSWPFTSYHNSDLHTDPVILPIGTPMEISLKFPGFVPNYYSIDCSGSGIDCYFSSPESMEWTMFSEEQNQMIPYNRGYAPVHPTNFSIRVTHIPSLLDGLFIDAYGGGWFSFVFYDVGGLTFAGTRIIDLPTIYNLRMPKSLEGHLRSKDGSLRPEISTPRGRVQVDSMQIIHHDLLPGDANADGVFDTVDLVQIMSAGKFLTNDIAAWSQGDFNADGVFDQLDVVSMLASGNCLSEEREALPEPSSLLLAVVGMILLLGVRNGRKPL